MKWLLAASLLALSPIVQAAMQVKPVSWTLDGTEFSGSLVYDDAGAARPGLLMVPNWFGVNQSAVDKAKAIAGNRYVVLVADVYGSDIRPADAAAAGAQIGKMYADRPALRARAAKALEVLKAQAGSAPLDPSRLGAVGFCFGGGTVLELARGGADLAGVVTLHGALDTTLPAKSGDIKASLLVLNGADDTYVSATQIAGLQAELTAAGADWQFVNFAGAVHCFSEADANSPPGCVYHERSAKRAYRMLHDFFAERFARP